MRPEEAEDPASIPIFWVSKWMDYSDKYASDITCVKTEWGDPTHRIL